MKNQPFKMLLLIPLIISVLAAILMLVMISKGDEEVSTSADAQAVTVVPLFYITYIVLGICALAALVFPILHTIKNPKNIKSMAIGLGSFGLLMVIAYAMATDVVPPSFQDTVSPLESKWVGTGLYLFYILVSLSILGILYAEVSRFFK